MMSVEELLGKAARASSRRCRLVAAVGVDVRSSTVVRRQRCSRLVHVAEPSILYRDKTRRDEIASLDYIITQWRSSGADSGIK